MKEKEPKERIRKEYAHAGGRSQKMLSFRLDLENIEYLNSKSNKGRFINELIATARAQESKNTISNILHQNNKGEG